MFGKSRESQVRGGRVREGVEQHAPAAEEPNRKNTNIAIIHKHNKNNNTKVAT